MFDVIFGEYTDVQNLNNKILAFTLLPSLSTIPFLAHSSHADPGVVDDQPAPPAYSPASSPAPPATAPAFDTCTARHHDRILEKIVTDGAEQLGGNLNLEVNYVSVSLYVPFVDKE